MSTRAEQKLKTRQNILNAAVKVMNEDRGLAALSLREVAKEAGIAPTSFYRHFETLEDMGLELVKAASAALHQIIKDARLTQADSQQDMVQKVVHVTMDHFRENGPLIRVLAREAMGSSRILRRAIKKELQLIKNEITDLIAYESKKHQRNITDPELVADAILDVMFYTCVSAINMPYALQKDAERRLVHHIRAIYIGAETMANTLHIERQLMLS
ncbi:MAG: HTH-type transcriptional repressor FabR [Pseudomonadales bacterium]|nr:HTH-type transcriptional repressor FabR [Pseudomonadales bacterium]